MEAVEEMPVSDAAPSVLKSEDSEVIAKESNEVCESNGVETECKTEEAHPDVNNTEKIAINTVNDTEVETNDIHGNDISVSESVPPAEENEKLKEVNNQDIEIQQNAEEIETVETVVNEVIVDDAEAESESNKHEVITEVVEEIVIPTNSEEVKFETEILIEENDVNENVLTNNEEIDSSTYILNDLAPNIELSEVLRSSDVADNSENNNSTDKHEVFNKEELLDILEGNDVNECNDNTEPVKSNSTKLSEAEIALKQLSKLKRKRNKTRIVEKAPKPNAVNSKPHKVEPENVLQNKPQQAEQKKDIVNVLVMDWEDEETVEGLSNNSIEDGDDPLKDSEELKISQEESITLEVGTDDHTTKDSSMGEDSLQASNKTEDEIPPRRLSRVIKKKVIFDPDNPDTFTKGKTPVKSKEIICNKDQTPSKKIKPEQNIQRSKSKSPLSKMQWKKPSPKNSKQNKRLSEVDKLLMDEGAVNMIYQLTPEATKGKKNIKTKAEFIKKLQSSTPEGKEMKFRERKKEFIKYEDGEPKKILSGKQRASLSSSVKSPASEDFETHSADDSIIYRRHSSSSYSSSCMSPRRLSDVEVGSTHCNARLSQQSTSIESAADMKINSNIEPDGQKAKDMFNPESENKPASEIINKSDCLSIKEKLNSKLSLALNKRKREASKIDKPAKQKKIMKPVEQKDNQNIPKEEIDKFNFVSITLDQRLAVISVHNTGEKIGVEVLKELEMALNYIDKRKDISITLFSSQCAAICSFLDLALLVNENKEIRVHYASELAESIKCLLSSVARHSKLVWCGMSGACLGVSLSLVALSDVSMAADDATFGLAGGTALLLPGAAVLISRCQLSQTLVNDLVIFGRRLTASEAVSGGLISRTLYPDKFDEQMLNIAKDVAAQPLQNVLLKKRLLNLKYNNGTEGAFLSSLESERDLFVEHWSSVEGQELLRASLDAA